MDGEPGGFLYGRAAGEVCGETRGVGREKGGDGDGE